MSEGRLQYTCGTAPDCAQARARRNAAARARAAVLCLPCEQEFKAKRLNVRLTHELFKLANASASDNPASRPSKTDGSATGDVFGPGVARLRIKARDVCATGPRSCGKAK